MEETVFSLSVQTHEEQAAIGEHGRALGIFRHQLLVAASKYGNAEHSRWHITGPIEANRAAVRRPGQVGDIARVALVGQDRPGA